MNTKPSLKTQSVARYQHLKAASGAHYERLVASRTRKEFLAEGWGWGSCPLCLAHRDAHGVVRCHTGCPVYLETGEERCRGTPWLAMRDAIESIPEDATLDAPLPEVLAMRDYLAALDF